MMLNVALVLMLLLIVGALVSSHRSGWLADFLLRSPGSYSKSSYSSQDREKLSPRDREMPIDRSVGIKAQ